MYRYRQLMYITAAVGLSVLIAGIFAVMPLQTQPRPASASQNHIFDHSNCQYPDRWSNPADGCDNSDPAVPECMKAANTQEGEQLCIAAFVRANNQPDAVPVTTAPTAPTSTVNICGCK